MIGLRGIPNTLLDIPFRSNELLGSSCPGVTRAVLNGSQVSCGYAGTLFYVCVAGAGPASPGAWINSDDPAKDPRKVRLITHPAVDGDL